MKKFILDLLFPMHCLGCGKEGKFICEQCLEQIPLNEKPIKIVRRNNLQKIIAVADYKNRLVKNAIHRYKYDLAKELSKPLGALMAKKLNNFLNTLSFLRHSEGKARRISSSCHSGLRAGIQSPNRPIRDCVLIPIPLHKKRLRWRGFNQSELLCREIAKILDITVADNILARAKNTPPQAKIENISKRESNIQNAFALEKRYWGLPPQRGQPPMNLKNKTIILVDDITTTGATLKECAQAIAPLHPKSIYALVLAR